MPLIKLVSAENPERYQRELEQFWRAIHQRLADELEHNLRRIFYSDADAKHA